VALAVSENVRRRHLDTGQLALFTVEHLLPQFEAEARERERAGKKHPQFPGTEGPSEAAAAAGKVTGVSASSVKRAKLIKTHGTPAEVDAVRMGKTKLKTAAAHVQARRTRRRRPPSRRRSLPRSARLTRRATRTTKPCTLPGSSSSVCSSSHAPSSLPSRLRP
jgi:hypothetical protein